MESKVVPQHISAQGWQSYGARLLYLETNCLVSECQPSHTINTLMLFAGKFTTRLKVNQLAHWLYITLQQCSMMALLSCAPVGILFIELLKGSVQVHCLSIQYKKGYPFSPRRATSLLRVMSSALFIEMHTWDKCEKKGEWKRWVLYRLVLYCSVSSTFI